MAFAAAAWQDDLLPRAIRLHQAGDYAAAIRLYREYLRSGPPSVDAFTNYGAALAHEGEYGQAIEQYRQALQLAPAHPPALLNLGLAYFKIGDYGTAREQLTAVRLLMPGNPQVVLLLANCHVQLGDYKRAIELLEPVEQEKPDDLAVAYLLGTALIRDGQADRGSRAIDKILRKGDSAPASLLLGTVKLKANDFAGAAEDLRKAVQLDPRLPEAHGYLGMALLNIGEPARAEEAFRKELELNPNNFTAWLQLGVMAKQNQKYGEARNLFARALNLRPGDAGVRYQVATLDVAAGRFEDARQSLEALVRESPQFREAHVSLATVYYRLKRKADGDREQAVVRGMADHGPAPSCGSCHPAEARAHAGSCMGRALMPAGDAPAFADASELAFAGGPYRYSIRRDGKQVTFSVVSPNGATTAPAVWAFGAGKAGQTFLIERNRTWYESAVSFYPAIGKLDWTPGHTNRPRSDIETALGRPLDAAETRRCFGCHAGGSPPADVKAGVQCAQCHEGGEQHAAGRTPMRRLGALGAEELSEVCARCHATRADVAANGPRGVNNVRHQIYRLATSKCYDGADRRIACTTCHDLHKDTVQPASSYDARCQACHATTKQCKAGSQDCVTCHMPKVDMPGMHFRFTDHRIRIARAGQAYPD